MPSMDRRAMGLLSLAHLADDVNQSFLPALLPFLIAQRGLDFAAAATLIFAANVSSSVVQPAIGWLVDRRPLPWIVPAGLLLAGGGVALVGVAPNYPFMLGAALLSGLGVAAFHPEAARLAHYVAGERKTGGMRWFAAGGNAGFAAGPLLASGAVVAFGLRGSLVAALPVAVMALLLSVDLPRIRALVPKPNLTSKSGAHDDWPAFARLSVFVVLRSMTFIGLVTFVPLYFVGVIRASALAASIALTVLLSCGVLGTLAGGAAADRFGKKVVLIASTGVSALLIVAFVAATAHGAPLWIAFAAVASIGFALVASQASYVVLGQEFLPNRMGIASGVTLGLAVSLGGAVSPALGAIADKHGLPLTLLTLGGFCLLAFLAALAVPDARRRQAKGLLVTTTKERARRCV